MAALHRRTTDGHSSVFAVRSVFFKFLGVIDTEGLKNNNSIQRAQTSCQSEFGQDPHGHDPDSGLRMTSKINRGL